VLVEAAVLTPVLFVLVYGVLEFSWIFFQQQLVVSGVRDAARYLAQMSSNPCSNTTWVSNAQNLAATGTIGSGGTARVLGWSSTDVNISCPAGNTGGFTYNAPTTTVLVQTSFAFTDPGLGLFGMLGLQAPNISVSHQERAIGG